MGCELSFEVDPAYPLRLCPQPLLPNKVVRVLDCRKLGSYICKILIVFILFYIDVLCKQYLLSNKLLRVFDCKKLGSDIIKV